MKKLESQTQLVWLFAYCNTTIKIITPKDLIEKISDFEEHPGRLEYSTSLFGDIDYRTKSLYQIFTVDSVNGCDPIISDMGEQTTQTRVAYIMKRGDCTFSRKVYNVRQAGGEQAIVYNDNDGYQRVGEKAINTVPIADKKFRKETVPMILISMENGMKILEALKNKQKIIMSTDFDVPKAEDQKKSNLDIWFSVTDPGSYVFLNRFKWYYQNYLASIVNFKPIARFHSQYDQLNHQTEEYTEVQKSMCWSSGNFCVDEKEKHIYRKLELLEEGVRQMCLFEQDTIESKKPVDTSHNQQLRPKELWFRYMEEYKQVCLPKIYHKDFSANECSQKISKRIEIDYQALEDCVEASWRHEKADEVDSYDSFGKIIKWDTKWNFMNQKLIQGASSQYIVPNVYINQFMYRGNVEPYFVSSAVCDSFNEKHEECMELRKQIYMNTPGSSIAYVPAPEDMHQEYVIFGMIGFGFFTLFLCVFCVRKHFQFRIQNDIQTHVNDSVGSYLRLGSADQENVSDKE